jgi:glycerophosphoryl diester phosphodiesterase
MRLGDGGPDVQRSGAPAAHSRLDVGAADEARDAHGTHEVPRADVVAGTRRPSGETMRREVVPELRWHPMRLAVCAEVLVLLACVVLSAAGTVFFDTIFPAEVTTRVIAHRGGGNEGPENTVAGLRAAAELGAWASEIDIQRTADGAYVVNHDKTFRRTTGDRHKPGKLTLAEAQKLRVDGEPVASYEDMLDAAHETGLVLFVELKGKSADEQMAKDAVRIARARGMLDSCVFISLDYALIDYLERTYPEAQTGFLTWASYGDETALNCDYLALEELSADAVAIETAHTQGKQVFVWTANTHDEQHRFLAGRADAIITDEVAQAMEVTAELEARSDFQRIVDAFLVLA